MTKETRTVFIWQIKALLIMGASLLLLASTSFAADKVFYYHTDPAGTPLAMTDSTGNVVRRADNRPFTKKAETLLCESGRME